MNFIYLIGSFAVLTLLAAGAFWRLSLGTKTNGIYYTSDPKRVVDKWDCLYFSVATETTVGYGDLAPQGTSRLVACVQAFAGLALMGMAVFKITAGPTRLLKAALDRTAGDWIELTYFPAKDSLIISLVTIAYVENSLRYDGDNIDQYGRRRGSFRGHLHADCDLRGDTLTFEYTNRQGDTTEDFDEGTTVLTFADLRWGRYMSFEGHATEKETKEVKKFYGGYRAISEEKRWMAASNQESRLKIARKYAGKFCSETKRALWTETPAGASDVDKSS